MSERVTSTDAIWKTGRARGPDAQRRDSCSELGQDGALGAPESRAAMTRTATAAATEEKAPRRPMKADIQAIADEIRDALLRDFKDSLRERYARFLEAAKHTGLPVPALSVCGQGTQEIRYTKLLGYYMNPSGRHGLGSLVLKSIVDSALARGDQPIEVSASDAMWDEARVSVEFDLGKIENNGRATRSQLDVLVEASGVCVLVEQKLGSRESGTISAGELAQLKRYSKAFTKNHPDLGTPLKIFLTPDATLPRDDMSWIPLSHAHVIQGLMRLFDEDLPPVARHNLSALIWDLIAGPLGADEELGGNCSVVCPRQSKDDDQYLDLRTWLPLNVPTFESMLEVFERGLDERS